MEFINRVDGALTRTTQSKDEYKSYEHNPPHLFIANAKYFITASTYKNRPFIITSSAKERLYNSLQIEFTKYDWEIEDWVILDNHYHLMVNAPENSKTLPDIMKEVHRFTALWIKKKLNLESINRVDEEYLNNRVDGMVISKKYSKDELTRLILSKPKKIFYNYWDTCITYENSYFARLNYIWYNPVKHGYVDSPEEWRFGSYYYRYKEEQEEIRKIINKYPCDKVKVKDDF